jgi:hypothetical protein
MITAYPSSPSMSQGVRGAAPGALPIFVREASPAEVRTFFVDTNMTVLTLLGYSGAGYEDEVAMLGHVEWLLDQADSTSTIVNVGATLPGIGAAYEIAKRKRFNTSGIVSTRAKQSQATLSPCVDMVFFVRDDAWGGLRVLSSSLQLRMRWSKRAIGLLL